MAVENLKLLAGLYIPNPCGLVGAYAVVLADRGRITRERVGTDKDFKTAPKPVVDLGKDFADHYDQYQSRAFWPNAGITPDFPSAAAIMAGLWEAQGGGHVDGVIGIDPRAMAEILAVTGPVQVAGRALGADNVASFIGRDEYAVFGADGEARKQALSTLAGALFDKVTTGAGSSTGLVSGFARAGRGGHLQMWSRREVEQQVLQPLQVGGALPRDNSTFLEVVSQNSAGNKLDYYVRRKITYERLGPSVARVHLRLINTVDPNAVPPFVKTRADKFGPAPATASLDGTTTQILSFFVSRGSTVDRVRIDGTEVPAEFGTEAGHGYATVDVELRPGVPVELEAQISDRGGRLSYRQQPLFFDDLLDLRVPHEVR